MIESIRHKGLRRFYETGSVAGIRPPHARRLRLLLAALDTATRIEDMDVPGFRLHPLRGDREGRWSIWRLTFELQHGSVHLLDYEDYH